MLTQNESNDFNPGSSSFLSGGGEMGRLTREYDWAQSSLGPIKNWPQSLKTTISILLNTRFPMFLWWGDQLIQFYNDAYRPSLGNNGKHPAALGQNGADCWQEIWPVIKPLIDQVLSGGEATWSEDQLIPIYRNGKLEDVYWTFSYSAVTDDDGKINGVLVICNETTEKMVNQDQLRFAVEATELGTWDYNPLTHKFTANTRLKEWFGVEPEGEIELTLATNVIHKKDRDLVTEAIQKALQYDSGGLYDIEYTIIHQVTKKERIVRAKGKAWFNEEHIAYRFNGTLQDVTRDTTARKELEESELFTRNIIRNSEAAQSVWVGEKMVFEMVNEKMLEILGRDISVIGKPFMEAIPELAPTPLMDRLLHVLRTGEPYYQPEEMFVINRFGAPHKGFYNYSYKALTNSEGENFGIICTATEVTNQVLARQKIEEAEEKARLAINSAELGTYEIDLLTDEIKTSDRFNEIWGIDHGISRAAFAEFIHPDDRALRIEANKKALETGNLQYEARLIWKDRSEHWIKMNGTVVYDREGKPANLLGVVQDITKQKRFGEKLTDLVEERTLELQRSNENLLQFAHVASHDLKEPVRKIKTFALRLEDEYGDLLPEKGKRYLEKVHTSTERMLLMIEGVLAYSDVNSKNKVSGIVNLDEVFLHVEADLELQIQQKNAIIKKEFFPEIEGNPVLIFQLFYNLINNSLKFSKPGVGVEIFISSSVKIINEAEMVEITINDNGIGMESQYKEKIFDAFVRLNAKDQYEGTGLGLALCKKITELHKGYIYADNAKGGGMIFSVILPLKQSTVN